MRKFTHRQTTKTLILNILSPPTSRERVKPRVESCIVSKRKGKFKPSAEGCIANKIIQQKKPLSQEDLRANQTMFAELLYEANSYTVLLRCWEWILLVTLEALADTCSVYTSLDELTFNDVSSLL